MRPLTSLSTGTTAGIHVPAQIRRPRKILYLIAFFAFLYWFSIRHGLGQERLEEFAHSHPVAMQKLAFALPKKWRKTHDHVLRDDGYVQVDKARKTSEHPIYDLMEQAQAKFDGMIARQSKNLDQAVEEYKRRYGMKPPKGFDAWWKFTQENGVKIVDEVSKRRSA